jgi:hypothetical protein
MSISVQVVSHSPISLTYATPLISDTVSNIFFDVLLSVKNLNNNGSDRVVQISAVVPCDAGDYSNISQVISDGSEMIFPLTSRHTNWTSKLTTIHFSPTVSGVTCAAYRVLR